MNQINKEANRNKEKQEQELKELELIDLKMILNTQIETLRHIKSTLRRNSGEWWDVCNKIAMARVKILQIEEKINQ